MQQKEFYNTIGQQAVAEFKDRGSRFLAYAFAIKDAEDFRIHLQQLKKDHPKAVHHCFAYRIGLDGNNFRTSDDGEPSGTAGKPILGQIDSRTLTNTAVIVVRYFGGTLLGVPGLINAYKSAAAMALQLTPILSRAVEVNYLLQYDYTQMNEIMMLVKKYNCTVLAQDAQLFCHLRIGVPVSRQVEFLYKIRDLRNVEIQKA